jgi:hypothetical protein
MNKKIGTILAVFALFLVLCCLGGFFYIKQVADRINKVIAKDQAYVTQALNTTAKSWDEQIFSTFADDTFNTPAHRAETKKQFAMLKDKLGMLVNLGEVTTDKKSFKANNGSAQGFYVSFTATAKFEKGNAVFSVTVKNLNEQMRIFDISVNPLKSALAPKSP